ncbi:MAG TPA: glycogen synthase [Thermoanaerobaculia bacterium]|nr:glycogen synthase [Thermoanaerobaculia bacterium]
MRVLFLAAEAAPLVKVGGLGDVAGSLPRALAALGHDVRVAMPDATRVEDSGFAPRLLARYPVPTASGAEEAAASEVDAAGIRFLLVGGAPIPRNGRVYGSSIAEDGPKFAFFSRAALELCRALRWEPDVVHCHDSHAAPAAAWLSAHGSTDPVFRATASLVTIHNLPYMATGAGAALAAYDIPVDGEGLPDWARGGLLPVGLAHADEISTVSPTYAREIQTPEFGAGLDGFLRSRADRLTGILNGIDLSVWDPARDPALPRAYDAARLDARRDDRAALQKELGLDPDPDATIVGIVSRLEWQKGFDVAAPALGRWLESGGQLAAIGHGDPGIEALLAGLSEKHPSRAGIRFGFHAALARRIYAGVDLFLIPSRYEPCGLTQMIAMRYGAVPVARRTGGLADTIRDAAAPDGTGFLFDALDPEAVTGALERARALRRRPAEWDALVLRGMGTDFSWTRPARAYSALYERARLRRREEVAR